MAVAVGLTLLTGHPWRTWIPIHVWSLTIRYVDDYRRAQVPMLPVVIGVEQAARCVGWSALALCTLAAALPRVVHIGPGATVALALLQAPVWWSACR